LRLASQNWWLASRAAEVAAIADMGYYDISEDLLNEDMKKTYRVEILSSRKTMD